ncbi:MAG: SRPBCC domain-containing protein, partial [Pseudomonadales bacterium]|nr:SRPBCC domain-containing protein [Pseudomonadales bacterium]
MGANTMSEINHRVGIKASPAKIYGLLTTDAGLAQWWTNDVTGSGDVASVIAFRFNGGGPDFAVTELIPNQLVRWQHSGNTPADWMGTDISFYLSEQEGQTIVRFAHSGWQEVNDFLAHCSTKWAVFLLSLKDAAETGQGKPFPNDIHIDYS